MFGTEKFNYIDSKKINGSGSPDCPQIDNYNYEGVSVRYEGNNPNLSPAYFNAPYAYDSLIISGKYYYNIKDFTAINSTVDLCFLYTLKEGIIQLIYAPTNDTLNLIKLEI